MHNIVSFPRYGVYTNLFTELIRDMGLEVLPPEPITKRTLEFGTKYSPCDICYPFKVTLGTMIEALDKGANKIMMIDSAGWCILRCYSVVQARILKDLGYDFQMVSFNIRNPFKFYNDIKKISPKVSLMKIVSAIRMFYKKAKQIDEAERRINAGCGIKIGIIGEVHVCNENAINMDIVKKLQKLGAYVDRWLCLSGNLKLLTKEFLRIKGLSEYRRKAWRYFPQRTGGHANENIVRLIKYASEGYDGVIMLKPFACNPETIIEPVVEKISVDYSMPILSISIDESMLETHFNTRLESFVDMIKMSKDI